MKVALRYFASVREALGRGESTDVSEGTDVAALRDLMTARGGRHAEALGRNRPLRSACNGVVCNEDVVLSDGDEVAFFPPVTGG